MDRLKEYEISEFLWDCEDLEYGEERLRRVEEAVEAADFYQNAELQFQARLKLIDASTFTGFIEKAIVAFSWCVALSDKEPDVYPSIALLWSYKWINLNMIQFSSISRERINATMKDFQKRYEAQGVSLRPVHCQHVRNHIALSADEERVRKALNDFVQSPRDRYSDCAACEQNFLVSVCLFQKDFEKAKRYAAPIFNGTQSCAEVPHITYAIMTLPSFFEGELELAERYATQATRLCMGNRDFLEELSDVMAYRIATGKRDAALEIYKQCYRWDLETRMDWRQLKFCVSAALLFETFDPSDLLTLNFPKDGEMYNARGEYQAQELVDFYTKKSQCIEKRFDERNGNAIVSKGRQSFREAIRSAR